MLIAMKLCNLTQKVIRLSLFFVIAVMLMTGSQVSYAQAKLPRVGFLTIGSPSKMPVEMRWLEIFRRILAEQGFVDGKTVTIVLRDAQGSPANFPQVAAEMTKEHFDVIYANSAPAVRALHDATKSIPIVGVDYTNDPIAVGYAKSYGRPGGNVTGVFLDAPEFAAKWLEMMREIVPNLKRVVALWDPSPGDTHVRAMAEICRSFKIQLQVITVRTANDIDSADAQFANGSQAIVALPSPVLYSENARLVKLATKLGLPISSMFPNFADAGGLLGYGPNDELTEQSISMLVAKILRGAKPGDLPIERPVKFDLIVNLKTAKALKIKMPETVLTRAERIIR